MRIEYSCICNRGLVRKNNQDNIVWEGRCLPRINEGLPGIVTAEKPMNQSMLFGVFDGMGGEPCGDAAAHIAAGMAADSAVPESGNSMVTLCREMNRDVCRYARDNGLESCGTTAAMLSVAPEHIIGCNLGDSRIYLQRNGELIQMSEDHVLPLYSRAKPPLLQFLGIPEDEMLLTPSLFEKEPRLNDLYLICSDGLTDMLSEEKILFLLENNPMIGDKASALLDGALAGGGRDNVSCILIRIQ